MTWKENITVSVVIPAYNVEKYIKRAIDSVLHQTRAVDEIIVVDDGSTDRTVSLVREYGERISLFSQTNAGPSAARNFGISKSSGDYLAFLDADDVWLPEKIQLQLEAIKKQPEYPWCFTNLKVHNCNDGKEKIHIDPETVARLVSHDTVSAFTLLKNGIDICPSVLLIKRDVLLDAGCFETALRYGEDIDLYLKTAYRHEKFLFIDIPLVTYTTGRQGSATGNTKHKAILKNLTFLMDKHLKLSSRFGKQKQLNDFIKTKAGKWTGKLYRQGDFRLSMILLMKYCRILGSFFTLKMLILYCLAPFPQVIRSKAAGRLLPARKKLY